MQPKPNADTSSPLSPNVRFCIAVLLLCKPLQAQKRSTAARTDGLDGLQIPTRSHLVQAPLLRPGRRGDWRVALRTAYLQHRESTRPSNQHGDVSTIHQCSSTI